MIPESEPHALANRGGAADETPGWAGLAGEPVAAVQAVAATATRASAWTRIMRRYYQREYICAEQTSDLWLGGLPELGDVVVRTTHSVRRLDGNRSRVTYRMEISGLRADTLGPQIGPEISADFPQTLAALVGRAEDR